MSRIRTSGELSERAKKAFDFAADTTKQLITISTAVITLTVTFSKNVYQNIPSSLIASWIFYFLSILFGVFTLLTLTGTLGKEDSSPTNIYISIIRIPSLAQLMTFILGLLSFTLFAFST